jgi:hypothetical protein
LSERPIIRVVWLPGLFLTACLAPTALADPPAATEPREQITDDRLSLVDLPAYLAALSGRATNDAASPLEPAKNASFRELWDQPATFQGHRVRVEGRVERIFRQGPVGSFPPIAEAWIYNPNGEPICIEFPVDGGDSQEPGVVAGRTASKIPDKGTIVEFTGTFLKRIRYAASDGDRLAPLIVGDRYPLRRTASTNSLATPARNRVATDTPTHPAGAEPRPNATDGLTATRGQWTLAGLVAAMTVTLLLRLQLRRPPARGTQRRSVDLPDNDPPLEFIEPLPPASEIKPGRNGNHHH